MIPRRIKQVLCNLKENTSVSFAHIATMGGLCNLDLLLIKATSPDDFPLNDRYVHHLLKILSVAPTSCRTFVSCFTRRFIKTQCWRVALKSLLLLHRLLRSMPVNSHFRVEMLRARLNGAISLNPCSFHDISSSSAAEDYSVFVRSYAYLIDEALECFAIDIFSNNSSDETALPEAESLSEKMTQVGRLIEALPQLQSLIDRVMNCRPKGAAGKNFLVQTTMKYIIRDSFTCYTSYKKEIVVILENLIQLPHRDCIEAFGIYKKAAIQAIHLSEFYEWSKPMGYCGAYEYPFVDQIPEIQIRALGTFLQGMWQLPAEKDEEEESFEPSKSSALIQILSPPSNSSTMEDDVLLVDEKKKEQQQQQQQVVLVKDYHKEMEPLIQLEDDNNEVSSVSWEVLLEASLPNPNPNPNHNHNHNPNPNPNPIPNPNPMPNPPPTPTNHAFFFNNFYGYGPQLYATNFFANNQWQIQVWTANGNPFGPPSHFYQTYNMPFYQYHGSLPNPTYPLTF